MKNLLILAVILAGFATARSQDSEVVLPHTTSTWLYSEMVQDSFLIQCYIPPDYTSSMELLPVIFVLDADMCFGMTYDIVRWLRWGNEIPEVAIVGIAYGKTQDEWWNKRSRDYTVCQDLNNTWGEFPMAGEGINFIHFLDDELIPFIGEQFNLVSTNRTITGLSSGGLMATNILFMRTELFENYIIAGPALKWNNEEIFQLEEIYAGDHTFFNACVYNAVGSMDAPNIINPWQNFNNQVLSRNLTTSHLLTQ